MKNYDHPHPVGKGHLKNTKYIIVIEGSQDESCNIFSLIHIDLIGLYRTERK